MKILALVSALLAILLLGLQFIRWTDRRTESRVWKALTETAEASPATFDPTMVDTLPGPARRYFLFTIAPGTPLCTVSEIRMSGEIALGDRLNPNYLPMQGHQILAPPYGLIWNIAAGRGVMRLSGSDGFDGGRSWTRFWLLNLLPVVRTGLDADHARSAFGRVVAEAVFWAPAALLPQNGASWEVLDERTARVTLSHNVFTQTVDITVTENGQPVRVVMPRWSNANPEKTYRLQPFGGYLSDFIEFDGFTLPAQVEGGNFIGTEDYFPFYRAKVESLRFCQASSP